MGAHGGLNGKYSQKKQKICWLVRQVRQHKFAFAYLLGYNII